MAKEDWVSCKIPVLMAESVDKFLQSDLAKKNGIFSRTDFLSAVVRMWFYLHEKDFRMFFTTTVPMDNRRVLENIK